MMLLRYFSVGHVLLGMPFVLNSNLFPQENFLEEKLNFYLQVVILVIIGDSF